MPVLLVASSQPRVGRSLVAATVAYRLGRDGRAVTLARLAGDDGAAADARTFASIEQLVTPGRPVSPADIASLGGDVVIEAPAGDVSALAGQTGARVLAVGTQASPPVEAAPDMLAGSVITRVPAADVAAVSQRAGTVAVLAEDRVLAAPSVAAIAEVTGARWLVESDERGTVERVMIGTVASDAASPYFANRERTCIVTRFDKTDIQLAALLTNLECLLLTAGGEPSPYLLDRAASMRDGLSVLLAAGSTVEVMRDIEALYGVSRFDGAGKLMRAVELFDTAGVPVEI